MLIYQSYLLFVLIFIGKLLVIYHGFLATSPSKENFFTRIYFTISNYFFFKVADVSHKHAFSLALLFLSYYSHYSGSQCEESKWLLQVEVCAHSYTIINSLFSSNHEACSLKKM